ncbi:MAG: ribose-phosphate pyrophosphokinase [Chloroflexi bacterium]|nr:ribose-phosphate pyrophosphokinase [Chloroflexota bacterium]
MGLVHETLVGRASGNLLGKLNIFTGNANPALARAICDYAGIPLGQAEVFQFSNENIFVKINETVREQDVFIIQPFGSPVSRSILELLIIIDAMKRASAARITAVIPYFAYGRTDKKDQPRVPITARLLADLITVAGAHRVLTMDLHAGQIQGFFSIPVDELSALNYLSRYFLEKGLDDLVVVAPDLGVAKKARNIAERLNAPLAVIEKRRVANTPRSEILNVIGDVARRRAIIIDDEIDTGGSMLNAQRVLEEAGTQEIYAACTHGLFSGPAIDRLSESRFVEVVTTDTLPLPDHKRIPKIVQLSVAPLFAEAIQRIHGGGSVGALFT